MKKNIPHFDAIVVGTGILGTLMARRLYLEGQTVLVCDEQEAPGGSLRSSLSASGGQKPLSLNHFGQISDPLKDWIQACLRSELQVRTHSLPPMTYESGEFKEFVGFGELDEVDYLDLMSHHGLATWVELSPSPEEIIAEAHALGLGTCHFANKVTQAKWADSRWLIACNNNSASEFSCSRLIWCAPWVELGNALGEVGLPAKARQRLSKLKSLGMLTLAYQLKPEFLHKTGVHILQGSGEVKDPIWGRFLSTDSGELYAVWQGLMESARTVESEEATQFLRHMKRQIKRPYPQFFDNVLEEKIQVRLQAYGSFVSSEKGLGTFPGSEALVVCQNLESLPQISLSYRLPRHVEHDSSPTVI